MDKIKIKNRSDSYVGYEIPDMHLTRDFAPNEDKMVEKIEIEKLSFQPGGQELINAYFQIFDTELAKEISPNYAHEPEYTYTKEDVKRIILEASVEEFEDCLDFSPKGIVEQIKFMAVSLPMTDTRKMKILQDRYGINVQAAIENIKDEEEQIQETTKTRRVAVPDKNTAAEGSYNVVRRVQK